MTKDTPGLAISLFDSVIDPELAMALNEVSDLCDIYGLNTEQKVRAILLVVYRMVSDNTALIREQELVKMLSGIHAGYKKGKAYREKLADDLRNSQAAERDRLRREAIANERAAHD